MFGVHIDRYIVMTSNIIQYCNNAYAFRFLVMTGNRNAYTLIQN